MGRVSKKMATFAAFLYILSQEDKENKEDGEQPMTPSEEFQAVVDQVNENELMDNGINIPESLAPPEFSVPTPEVGDPMPQNIPIAPDSPTGMIITDIAPIAAPQPVKRPQPVITTSPTPTRTTTTPTQPMSQEEPCTPPDLNTWYRNLNTFDQRRLNTRSLRLQEYTKFVKIWKLQNCSPTTTNAPRRDTQPISSLQGRFE